MRANRSCRWIPLLLTLILATVPVFAEEILHFTNGTTMPVKAHTVVGEMIHVELGINSYLAFPLAQIEKVTRGGEELDLVRSLGERNRMAAAHAPNAAMVEVESNGALAKEDMTMEEKVREYTRKAREGGLQPEAPPLRAGMSNSAALRSVEFAGSAGAPGSRAYTVGATQNLSGQRLGFIRPDPRKTVGGTIILDRGMPNKAKVELVGKQRLREGSPTGSKAGTTNNSSTSGGSGGGGSSGTARPN